VFTGPVYEPEKKPGPDQLNRLHRTVGCGCQSHLQLRLRLPNILEKIKRGKTGQSVHVLFHPIICSFIYNIILLKYN